MRRIEACQLAPAFLMFAGPRGGAGSFVSYRLRGAAGGARTRLRTLCRAGAAMTTVVALADARRCAQQHRPLPQSQSNSIRVLTINTHKGLAPWNRRFMLGELRDAVRSSGADIVFLQEVAGEERRASRGATRVPGPHYEFLADELWPQFAYGRNAVYPHGHHGNALLSRFPIVSERNRDISVKGPEPRGLLHCVLDVPQVGELHAVCVHLSLRGAHRERELQLLKALVEAQIAPAAPLVVAGDFNDWRGRADTILQGAGGLHSAFARAGVAQPRTFPARWPLLALDRIYVSNLRVQSACVLSAMPWPHLSDHLPLLAELCP